MYAETNGRQDVFVRDRLLGVTDIVPVNELGLQGDHHSEWPVISGDGSAVAFVSEATTNLVPRDTNGAADVFVRLGPCRFPACARRLSVGEGRDG